MGAMKNGARYYLFHEQVQTSTSVNGFLYHLRKLPLIGNKIPNQIYQGYGLKKALFVILLMIRMLFGVLKKFFWLGIYYVIASLFQSGEGEFFNVLINFQKGTVELGLLLWFLFVVLLRGFGQGWSYTIDAHTIAFVENFSLSKKLFTRSKMIIDVLGNIALYVPAALVFGGGAGAPIKVLLGISLLYGGVYYFCLYLGRVSFEYQRKSKMPVVFIWGCLVVGMAAIIGFFNKGHWGQLLFTPIVLIVAVLLLIASLWKIMTFKRENAYLVHIYDSSSTALLRVQTAKQQQDLDLSIKNKMVLDHSDKIEEMSGSNYLNALLFHRYRNQLHKDLRIRLIGITIIGSILLIAVFFTEQKSVEELYRFVPTIFFFMYLVSFGKKMVQMLFINCDAAMLHYPFYREKNVIHSGFIYRFKRILIYNGLLAGLSYFFFVVASIINTRSFSLTFVGITGFTSLSLVLLLSFHELFIYYLLQPFSSDMKVVNPLYRGISGAMYYFAWLNSRVESAGIQYVVLLGVGSVLYVLIGFVIILHQAPKTFKIK